MNDHSNIILAIDPGYDRMGWACGSNEKGHTQLLSFGCIQTKKTDTHHQRLQQLQSELAKIIQEYTPSQVAIENIYFSKNQKTALQVAEARGIIIGTCLLQKLPITEYNPNSIKLAVTGYGNANKAAVDKMIRLQFGTQIPNTAIIDDAMDAIAILLTHTVTRT